MGVRGELFTTQVVLNNRAYFFNVKENRTGDVFLQVVESKNKNGENIDRHAIVVFAEDMQKFCKGLEESLQFIEKDQKEKKKKTAEKKAEKQNALSGKRKVQRKKNDSFVVDKPLTSKELGIKKTGKVHVVSKRVDK